MRWARHGGFPRTSQLGPVRKLEYVDLATGLDDLKVPPGNRLHALKGETGRDSTQSRSTTSGGYAFGSRTAMRTT
jgi:plasmid maintenance system killer protein